jgi:2-phosphosulfolactate phosphatase
MQDPRKVEVVFTPDLFHHYNSKNSVVVVVDILRATSAICTAFENGADEIIPVPGIEEAKEYKKLGYVVAAERDGKVLEFADFGNSPYNFTVENVKDQKIAYSTINGAKSVRLAQNSKLVLIASFINLSAIASKLREIHEDVIILCAGWKGKFCLEDTVFAGALVEKLTGGGLFYTRCDSAVASLDIWSLAKSGLKYYADKAAQTDRLRRFGKDSDLDYIYTTDTSSVIPVYHEGLIKDYQRLMKDQ